MPRTWNESDHPRNDDGEFIDAGDLDAAAAGDSNKADELRRKVNKPDERAKLDRAIGSKVFATQFQPAMSAAFDAEAPKLRLDKTRLAELVEGGETPEQVWREIVGIGGLDSGIDFEDVFPAGQVNRLHKRMLSIADRKAAKHDPEANWWEDAAGGYIRSRFAGIVKEREAEIKAILEQAAAKVRKRKFAEKTGGTSMYGETLRGVELFATGTFRGRRYDLPFLHRLAANAKKLGPSGLKLLRPPAVLGHEEDQGFLDNTGMPAAAWLNCDSLQVRTYRDPATGQMEGTLVGDFSEVPPAISAMVRAKRYRKVSVELYDDFEDDHGRSHGPAIRRVAMLGGEIPQVKRLADLPVPTAGFGEKHGPQVLRIVSSGKSRQPGCIVLNFFEGTTMDRETMIQAITDSLQQLDDAQLQDLLSTVQDTLGITDAASSDPSMAAATMSERAEASKVMAFAERHADVVRLSSFGSPSAMLSRFVATNAKLRAAGRPTLTAAQFTGQK